MSLSNFKRKRIEDPAWLKTVREMPCVLTSHVPPSDPAHIRYGCLSVGRKPDDDLVLPLAHELHAHQHNIGEIPFWREQMMKDDHFMMECIKAYARELYRQHHDQRPG